MTKQGRRTNTGAYEALEQLRNIRERSGTMGYEKAVLIPEDGKKEIKVQFNPAEYNLSRSTTYAEKKVLGLDDPFTQYIAGEAETLKITLMFDTYMPPGEKNAEESGSDVRLQTEKIAKLMELDPKKHRPPKVTFRYGSLIFSGVITELNQTFTMFLANGMPVRAKLEVTFRSMGKENTHVPLESPDRTNCRTLYEGQSLWGLAYEEYGDPEKWKEIARENHITNPLQVKPGQVLRLPAL